MLSQKTIDYFAQFDILASSLEYGGVQLSSTHRPNHFICFEFSNEDAIWKEWGNFVKDHRKKIALFEELFEFCRNQEKDPLFNQAFEKRDLLVLAQLFLQSKGLRALPHDKPLPLNWKENLVLDYQQGIFSHFFTRLSQFENFEHYLNRKMKQVLNTTLPEPENMKNQTIDSYDSWVKKPRL